MNRNRQSKLFQPYRPPGRDLGSQDENRMQIENTMMSGKQDTERNKYPLGDRVPLTAIDTNTSNINNMNKAQLKNQDSIRKPLNRFTNKTTMVPNVLNKVSKSIHKPFRSPVVGKGEYVKSLSGFNKNGLKGKPVNVHNKINKNSSSVLEWATINGKQLKKASQREEIALMIENLRTLEKKRRDMEVIKGLYDYDKFKENENKSIKNKVNNKENLNNLIEKWKSACFQLTKDIWDDIQNEYERILSSYGFNTFMFNEIQNQNTYQNHDQEVDEKMTIQQEYKEIDGLQDIDEDKVENKEDINNDHYEEENIFSEDYNRRIALNKCKSLYDIIEKGYDVFLKGFMPT